MGGCQAQGFSHPGQHTSVRWAGRVRRTDAAEAALMQHRRRRGASPMIRQADKDGTLAQRAHSPLPRPITPAPAPTGSASEALVSGTERVALRLSRTRPAAPRVRALERLAVPDEVRADPAQARSRSATRVRSNAGCTPDGATGDPTFSPTRL